MLTGLFTRYSNILKEDGQLVLDKMNKLFRFIGFASVLYIILELLKIREDIFKVAGSIVKYPITVGEMSISLGNLLAFFITIQIAVWISSLTRYILEREVFPRATLKHGIPNTILILIKFTFIVLGVLLAFSAAGVKIDKLAIAMGALGVGIGFGLQNIISNFVSGIILALERPITIGDLVDIPDVSGVVRDIGLRASTIRTWQGSDVIVPNATLISNKLTNWTFFDRLRRVKVDVRVPFGTNIEEVSQLLLKTASEIPEAMKKPKPYLNLKDIGTSAMEINLYCWIDDSDKIFSYGTAIRKAIYEALKEEGYDIPVPKQDIMIDSETVKTNK
jgi:small-conductance mechanosensitive channel